MENRLTVRQWNGSLGSWGAYVADQLPLVVRFVGLSALSRTWVAGLGSLRLDPSHPNVPMITRRLTRSILAGCEFVRPRPQSAAMEILLDS